jgi:L-galactono-1,4-lactone dehydrogenase
MKDLEYIEELMKLIEKEHVPAPAPIEQRWTAQSKSPMSPASSPNEDDIFSWVLLYFVFCWIISVFVGVQE